MEYGPGIAAGDEVELLVDESDDHLAVWFTVGGTVQAATRVIPLAGVDAAPRLTDRVVTRGGSPDRGSGGLARAWAAART